MKFVGLPEVRLYIRIGHSKLTEIKSIQSMGVASHNFGVETWTITKESARKLARAHGVMTDVRCHKKKNSQTDRKR